MSEVLVYCPEECKIIVDGQQLVRLNEEFLEEFEGGFTLKLVGGSASTSFLDSLSTSGREVSVSVEVGLAEECGNRLTEYDIEGKYTVYRLGCKLSTEFPVVIYKFCEA